MARLLFYFFIKNNTKILILYLDLYFKIYYKIYYLLYFKKNNYINFNF